MSDVSANPDNFCYRHPDRMSFVHCQRCGRTICPECQTQAAVGVHCPECVREARGSFPTRAPRIVNRRPLTRTLTRISTDKPIVSYAIIGLILLFGLVDQLLGGAVIAQALGYFPERTASAPWTMVTSMLAQIGLVSVLFNGFSIYIFGFQLEQRFGHGRYLLLFVLSGFGASVVTLLLGGVVYGAGGAIFGLMGAFLVFARRMGGNNTWLYILIGINLIFPLLTPTAVSWQGDVGGLIVGAGTAFIYLYEGSVERRRRRNLLLGGVAFALLLLSIVKVALLS